MPTSTCTVRGGGGVFSLQFVNKKHYGRVLCHHECKFSLSDICPGVEKYIIK